MKKSRQQEIDVLQRDMEKKGESREGNKKTAFLIYMYKLLKKHDNYLL